MICSDSSRNFWGFITNYFPVYITNLVCHFGVFKKGKTPMCGHVFVERGRMMIINNHILGALFMFRQTHVSISAGPARFWCVPAPYAKISKAKTVVHHSFHPMVVECLLFEYCQRSHNRTVKSLILLAKAQCYLVASPFLTDKNPMCRLSVIFHVSQHMHCNGSCP